ncbi:hypothetical protein R1flu_012812 [Riccia fluitans]|uniref:HTH OST-type domain-containing protein n=1 Tax=Riccia fluitans TaxID=41844 RepID=A0ABD1ZBM8_9MARC
MYHGEYYASITGSSYWCVKKEVCDRVYFDNEPLSKGTGLANGSISPSCPSSSDPVLVRSSVSKSVHGCEWQSTPLRSSRSSEIGSLESSEWLQKFKAWLPTFLDTVYKHLKKGEHYPLSALKGDFHASYELSMDHASLGYGKLSDFIMSLPTLCEVAIAPVGNGPATHSVLLPAAERSTRASLGPIQRPSDIKSASHALPAAPATSPVKKSSAGVAQGAYAHQPTSTIGSSNGNVDDAVQQDFDDDDVTYVCCCVCNQFFAQKPWMGVASSRLGFCSICKIMAPARDKPPPFHNRFPFPL